MIRITPNEELTHFSVSCYFMSSERLHVDPDADDLPLSKLEQMWSTPPSADEEADEDDLTYDGGDGEYLVDFIEELERHRRIYAVNRDSALSYHKEDDWLYFVEHQLYAYVSRSISKQLKKTYQQAFEVKSVDIISCDVDIVAGMADDWIA